MVKKRGGFHSSAHVYPTQRSKEGGRHKHRPHMSMQFVFQNGSPIAVRVAYKVPDPASPRGTQNWLTREVVVSPEGQGLLSALDPGLPIRVLVQPATTTLSSNVIWDWRVTHPEDKTTVPPAPDGVVIYVPAGQTTYTDAGLQGIFRYKVAVSSAPNVIRFDATILCGEWFTECPAVMGIPVSSCSGFQSKTGRAVCENWCATNPAYCDALKVSMCSAGAGDSDHYQTSPECVCIAKDASKVKLPATLDMTYTEFHALVAKATVLNITATPDVCWYPGCQDQALLTSTQAAAAATCPTSPEQICVNSIGSINFEGDNNTINLLNCCGQTVTHGGNFVPPPGSGVTPKPTNGPSSGGPSAGPGSGAAPAPAAGGLTTAAIIGIVAGAVVLIIIIAVVAVVASKK